MAVDSGGSSSSAESKNEESKPREEKHLSHSNKSHISMKRLSDFATLEKFSKVHPRLSPLDSLMTEFSYLSYLIGRFWGRNEALILALSFTGYLLGIWDFGIGELSGGGDYNRQGIFGNDSGFLHMNDLALIFSLLSVICWAAVVGLFLQNYPIMRENTVYLMIGMIFVQFGQMRAHSSAPEFPYGSGLAEWVSIIVTNMIMLFLSIFVVNRAVLETRDVHVQERHSHPDPRVFDRAWSDHSLKAWTFSISLWIIFLNISSWFGSHTISPSPGELEFSYLSSFLFVIFGEISILFLLLIIWLPQFMLGSAEDRIQTFRAREISGEKTHLKKKEQGKCPVCNQKTVATRDPMGEIIMPCKEEGCIGKGKPGDGCQSCDSPIPKRVVCQNCGSNTPIGNHFGRSEVW